MPELPEVETTRAGIAPHLIGKTVTTVIVRQRRLRWPVPRRIEHEMPGQMLAAVRRRAKYLILETIAGSAIIHLGMSGSLRVLERECELRKHDHFDICFENNLLLRFNDPRRFGCLLWTRRNPLRHRLLADLGPEPLQRGFDGAGLWKRSRGRKVPVKAFIMDAHTVVGVGNIYASEALHRAGIHPRRPAGRISRLRYLQLAEAIVTVLRSAVQAGGTTLRDFTNEDGLPGYFSQALLVYGKSGEPCAGCGAPIRHEVISQRSTFYCINCQR